MIILSKRLNSSIWPIDGTLKGTTNLDQSVPDLFMFYGISTFVGNLMPNPFLYKWTVLFQMIQFSISTQFNCQKNSILSYSV